jgi:hypothetical protein
MRRIVLLIAILPGLAVGCGDEGALSLRLLTAGFDKPYEGVDQFELATLDGDLYETDRMTAAVSDGVVELGLVPSGRKRLSLRGLGQGAMRSRGQSRPLGLESGTTSEELIPFATLQVAVALPTSRAFTPDFKVDGDLKEWQASPSLVLGREHRIGGAQLSSPKDLHAELMLAWDGARLAFALSVEDDCPSLRKNLPSGSCGTAVGEERVHLGFDGADDGGAYGQGDLWVELGAISLRVLRGSVSPAQLKTVLAPRRDLKGWVMEGALELSALGRSSLSAGDRIGFDLTIVDADPQDAESTALRWTAGPAAPDQPTAPDQMGTLGFGAAQSAP